MKTALKIIAATFILILGSSGILMACMHCGCGHWHSGENQHMSHGRGDHMGNDSMDHNSHSQNGHMGENIHNAKASGYSLAYYFIDMGGRMKNAGHRNHHKRNAPRSLRVHIKDRNGQALAGAEVSHTIKGADGKRQKVICADMNGVYEGYLNLRMPQTYEIQTEITVAGKILTHKFNYNFK